MVDAWRIRGSIDEVITNSLDVYEGDLRKYFYLVFHNAKNLRLPYHNFRHMTHVAWLAHNAVLYYQEKLTRREARNLLVAALFHDFDHTGRQGNDDINIQLAVRGLRRHLLPEDEEHFEEIKALIEGTQYPYVNDDADVDLSTRILRDADLSQALSPVWMQQVVFGLAAEWEISPLQLLQSQGPFQRSLEFRTAWARELWPDEKMQDKLEEIERILQLLEHEP